MPLKHLSNFYRTFDIPSINCEINLVWTWSENCVLTSKATRIGVGDNRINNPTNGTLKRTDTTLYVRVITLSTEND